MATVKNTLEALEALKLSVKKVWVLVDLAKTRETPAAAALDLIQALGLVEQLDIAETTIISGIRYMIEEVLAEGTLGGEKTWGIHGPQ